MGKYWDIFVSGYSGYANYLKQEILFAYDYKPWWENYFYWLILVSGFFLMLEWMKPWRKEQPKFRKDFWLDFFYMFFNFFLFSLIVYNAVSMVFVTMFNDFLAWFGVTNLVAIKVNSLSVWVQLLILFIVRDFVQWNVHRLLHRSDRLWEFHKVHHSVEEMGFAAQMRFHWMENIVYNALQYIPLAMIGFGIDDFFFVYMLSFTIGHFNHSNITVDGKITGGIVGMLLGLVIASTLPEVTFFASLGIIVGCAFVVSLVLGRYMKYIFNSPEMHIWHHSYHLPEERRYGVNFGLSLSCWDYIFKTAYIPHNGRDIKLGFPGMENYPKTFLKQSLHGFKKKE